MFLKNQWFNSKIKDDQFEKENEKKKKKRRFETPNAEINQNNESKLLFRVLMKFDSFSLPYSQSFFLSNVADHCLCKCTFILT